jgi:hypothetical protein
VKGSFSRFSDRLLTLGDWIGDADALFRAESRFLVLQWNEFDIRYPIDVGFSVECQIRKFHWNHKLASGSFVSDICLSPDTNGMQMLATNH